MGFAGHEISTGYSLPGAEMVDTMRLAAPGATSVLSMWELSNPSTVRRSSSAPVHKPSRSVAEEHLVADFTAATLRPSGVAVAHGTAAVAHAVRKTTSVVEGQPEQERTLPSWRHSLLRQKIHRKARPRDEPVVVVASKRGQAMMQANQRLAPRVATERRSHPSRTLPRSHMDDELPPDMPPRRVRARPAVACCSGSPH